MQYISKFSILNSEDINSALMKIDKNKNRFVIVIDEDYLVCGVLTDGDIRRLLLSGLSLQDRVKPEESFYFVNIEDGFEEVCIKFQGSGIDFLPILNQGKLYNVIIKKDFHVMLLEGVSYQPDYDFSTFQDTSIEHEIYNRPWGFYKSTLLTSNAQAKIITVFPDSEISLQYHSKREEHWVVVSGKGMVQLNNELIDVCPGKYIFIEKGCRHQIVNTSTEQLLVFSEVQLGDYFGEDDIIRCSDKYGRV